MVQLYLIKKSRWVVAAPNPRGRWWTRASRCWSMKSGHRLAVGRTSRCRCPRYAIQSRRCALLQNQRSQCSASLHRTRSPRFASRSQPTQSTGKAYISWAIAQLSAPTTRSMPLNCTLPLRSTRSGTLKTVSAPRNTCHARILICPPLLIAEEPIKLQTGVEVNYVFTVFAGGKFKNWEMTKVERKVTPDGNEMVVEDKVGAFSPVSWSCSSLSERTFRALLAHRHCLHAHQLHRRLAASSSRRPTSSKPPSRRCGRGACQVLLTSTALRAARCHRGRRRPITCHRPNRR